MNLSVIKGNAEFPMHCFPNMKCMYVSRNKRETMGMYDDDDNDFDAVNEDVKHGFMQAKNDDFILLDESSVVQRWKNTTFNIFVHPFPQGGRTRRTDLGSVMRTDSEYHIHVQAAYRLGLESDLPYINDTYNRYQVRNITKYDPRVDIDSIMPISPVFAPIKKEGYTQHKTLVEAFQTLKTQTNRIDETKDENMKFIDAWEKRCTSRNSIFACVIIMMRDNSVVRARPIIQELIESVPEID